MMILSECKIQEVAERALTARTWHHSRLLVRQLIEVSEAVMPYVADFEDTDNPFDVARNNLTFLDEMMPSRHTSRALIFVRHLEEQATNQQNS